jgi:hypothetical protein
MAATVPAAAPARTAAPPARAPGCETVAKRLGAEHWMHQERSKTMKQPLRKTSLIAAAALGLLLGAASVHAQLVVAQPVIDAHPQPLTVLSGEGAAFTVAARSAGGGFITRIDWRDGSGRVVQSGLSSSLSRTAWVAADAGDYTATVHHTSGLSVTSRPARLTVRASGWAPVGGRALPWPASARVPALELCGEPTVAWVELTPSGNRELRVHRFDGAQWRAIGTGSLMSAPTNSPNDPSLQCLSNNQRPLPVLAFSESWSGGGRIAVRQWDGRAWQAVGHVNVNPGAIPRSPVLRVRRYSDSGTVPRNSWLAWREGTLVRAAAYETYGDFWYDLTFGSLRVTALGPPLMVLDHATVYPEGLAWSPMIGAIESGAGGSRPRVLQYTHLNWVDLGAPPADPVQTGLRAVGMAFTSEIGVRRAMMAWTEGGSSFTLRSASLADPDYGEAYLRRGVNKAWGSYAADYTGSDLQATAFDPKPFDLSCGATGPDSFTAALASTAAVQVLMSRCVGGPLPRWVPVAPPLPVQALGLALKMIDPDTPLVAVVGPTGFGGHALTVWKYRP